MGSEKIWVREAREGDRDGILAVSREIWEGEDYVPGVLDRWLGEGGLFVAELGGKVVGFAKITELGPGEIWFEGLRVHPSYQGKGIAKALARAQLEYALARHPKTIRLATVEENAASLHIAKELGFREAARFMYLEADVERPKRLPALRRPDFQEAWDFLRRSEALQEAKGLVGLGWRFRNLTPEFLQELLEQSAVFALGDPVQGLLILAADPYTPTELASVTFIDGDEEALPKLLRFTHGWAAENGQRILSAMVAAPWLFRFLLSQGFQFIPELGAVLVLEYAPSPG